MSEPRCLINFFSNMCSWLGASKKTKLLNVCSIISSFSALKIEKVASYCPATFLAQSLFLQILINVVPLMGKRCRKICRKANILANIDIEAQLHLLRIVGPRPKLHITVLLIKGKPGSQKMKKVRGRLLTKLSREKLVERRAWKLSELKKGKEIFPHFSKGIIQYLQIFWLAPFNVDLAGGLVDGRWVPCHLA